MLPCSASLTKAPAPLLRRRAMAPPDSLATGAPVQQPRRLAVCQVRRRYSSFPASRRGCRSDEVLWPPVFGVRQENRTASHRDELRPNEPSEDGPIRSPGAGNSIERILRSPSAFAMADSQALLHV